MAPTRKTEDSDAPEVLDVLVDKKAKVDEPERTLDGGAPPLDPDEPERTLLGGVPPRED